MIWMTMWRDCRSAARLRLSRACGANAGLHGDASRAGPRVQAGRQFGAPGKQRGHVAILPHAEHHDVKRPWHPGQRHPGGRGTVGGPLRLGFQSNKTGRSRVVTQERGAHPAFIAVGVVRRHPALIGQRNLHP